MSNRISIKGRIAVEPELKFGKSGKAFLALSVPDQKRRKNEQTGQWEDQSATTWFRVTVFGEEAELLSEQLSKGTRVFVEGELVTREYTANDGTVKQSLELTGFPTVAVIPTAPRADRSQSPEPAWNTASSQADPWAATAAAPSGGAGNTYDEPPF